jgi:hypothetical protein
VKARRALSPMQATVLRLLGPIDGDRVHGGCPSCRAFQTAEPKAPGVWAVTVHHDDDCPVLAAHQGSLK